MANQRLRSTLKQAYGQPFDGEWLPLTGGYESDIWRCNQWVVRVGPAGRDVDQLAWTHQWGMYCAAHLPQVITPVQAVNDNTIIRWDDRPVTVYPYIAGTLLDLHDESLVMQAARLLAQIHALGVQWPALKPDTVTHLKINAEFADPPSIQDPQLDAWERDFFKRDDLMIGAVHGDYYRGNILCDHGRITGIIDWDESAVRPIITEVAWATWEFTHNPAGDDLNMPRARQFVRAYQAETDILSKDDISMLIPLIRRHLRYEIRRSIVVEARGEHVDVAYREAEIRAFIALDGRIL